MSTSTRHPLRPRPQSHQLVHRPQHPSHPRRPLRHPHPVDLRHRHHPLLRLGHDHQRHHPLHLRLQNPHHRRPRLGAPRRRRLPLHRRLSSSCTRSTALLVLTLILACYLFFEAIVEFIQYFQLRPRHGAVWLLVDGVITLILAIMIWRSWPASSIWVIGTLVGISMIFSGFSRLMLSFTAKRVLNPSPSVSPNVVTKPQPESTRVALVLCFVTNRRHRQSLAESTHRTTATPCHLSEVVRVALERRAYRSSKDLHSPRTDNTLT